MNKDYEARKERLRKQAEARLAGASSPVEDLSLDDLKALVYDCRVHQIELELQNVDTRNFPTMLSVFQQVFFDDAVCARYLERAS